MVLQRPQNSYTETPNPIHPYTWTPQQASLNHALSIPYTRQPPIRPGIRQRRRAEDSPDLVSGPAQPLEKAKTYNTYMIPTFQKGVHRRWINQPNAQERETQNCWACVIRARSEACRGARIGSRGTCSAPPRAPCVSWYPLARACQLAVE
jgi:hypothetical protein